MDIEDLVRQFEEEKLPSKEWTHHAHLAVCIWYIWHYPIEELPLKLRENIKKYNLSVGGKNTDMAGYHETITMFWLCDVKQFISDNDFKSPLEVYTAMLETNRMKSGYIEEYYSKDTIRLVRARKEWVMPDVKEYNTWGLDIKQKA